jgi:quercetin dioxygenase-like cupin family protein
MKSFGKKIGLVVAFSAAVLGAGRALAHQKSERARAMLTQPVPAMDGDHLEVTVVEVNYGPGESSTAHSHPCPVIGYVAQGALRTQVKGEAETILKAGQTFYEAPNGVHQVSANASGTEPLKLIAYFLCDRHTPRSVEAAAQTGEEE